MSDEKSQLNEIPIPSSFEMTDYYKKAIYHI